MVAARMRGGARVGRSRGAGWAALSPGPARSTRNPAAPGPPLHCGPLGADAPVDAGPPLAVRRPPRFRGRLR